MRHASKIAEMNDSHSYLFKKSKNFQIGPGKIFFRLGESWWEIEKTKNPGIFVTKNQDFAPKTVPETVFWCYGIAPESDDAQKSFFNYSYRYFGVMMLIFDMWILNIICNDEKKGFFDFSIFSFFLDRFLTRTV